MNSSDTTAGGYAGSAMYTGTLVTWAGYLATAFGSNLLTNRELITNAISGELPSNWSWYDSKVNLMTSEEVVGHGGSGMSGYNYGFNVGTGYGQLPLFRLAPDKISTRYNYWLRTITSSTYFARVGNDGVLNYGNASVTFELRPRFLLG
jgi:subtilase family serine protease